jgi:hypothetical protein
MVRFESKKNPLWFSLVIWWILLAAMYLSDNYFSFRQRMAKLNANSEINSEIVREQLPEKELTPQEKYKNWKRPDEPLRVGIQAGHWKNQELPEELSHLRERSSGATVGRITEWELNLKVAQLVKEKLEAKNIEVDLLPSTVPPAYWADAFVAIHADASEATSASGYKVSSPRWDLKGAGEMLSSLIGEEYGKITKLKLDPNITSNMREYYVFNWEKYQHSIHPMTAGAIVELGYLTNYYDRMFILNNIDKAAEGIVRGIDYYLLTNVMSGSGNNFSH